MVPVASVQTEASTSEDVKTFAGVLISDEETTVTVEAVKEKPEPLSLSDIQVTAEGRLTITFSKTVLWPKIDTVGEINSPERSLQTKTGYKIENLVSVRVNDDEMNEILNKKISNLKFISHNSISLSLEIVFEDPLAITADLMEPDTLQIEFIRPDLFVDN